MNSQTRLEEERYQILKITDSHENSQIRSLLDGQKYHSKLSLLLNLKKDKQKAYLIQKAMDDLTHLKELDIIFQSYSITFENPIQEILQPLRRYKNLINLKVEVQEQLHNVTFEKIIMEFANSLISLPQLETLRLAIPFFDNILEQDKSLLKKGFSQLKYLKEFRFKTRIININNKKCLDEILTYINQLKSLSLLEFQIAYGGDLDSLIIPLLCFDKINNLQELHITSYTEFSYYNISSVAEQIRYLKSLIKLNIKLTINNQSNEVNMLFNAILSLENLKELILDLLTYKNDIILEIGKEVYEESHLRVFCFKIECILFSQSQNHGKIIIGENIINIKHLEKLSLDFQSYSFSDESYQVFSQWVLLWNHLRELSFAFNYHFKNEEALKMFVLLRDCFHSSRQISMLDIKSSNFGKKTDFLIDLSKLSNLKVLSCSDLYEDENESNESQYLQCFKNLSKLKELQKVIFHNVDEVLGFGNSLLYLKELVVLKIEFYKNIKEEHFETFCRNLKELYNLKSLHIQRYQMNGKETQLLLQSIGRLYNLKQLTLQFNIPYFQQIIFDTELQKMVKELQFLNILTLTNTQYLLNQNIVLKLSKRLIKFLYIQK